MSEVEVGFDPQAFLARADSEAFMNDVMAKHEVFLPDVTASGTIAVGLAAGPRKHTVACVGAKATDRIILTPAATVPTGYMIGDARVPADDQLELTIYIPAVTLLASYSIGIRVTAIR